MGSRVLLVDDHAVLRRGLRFMLDEEQDLEVVGEAGDGCEAIELFRELKPDVVVMDISMKGLNGIEATHQIISEAPDTRVVALSIHSGRRYIEGMLGAGAAGYILKDSAPEDLVEGIRTVRRGEVFLSPAIAGVVVSGYKAILEQMSSVDGPERLTTREREILDLVVAGDSDAQIAAALRLDEDTIATARRRLLEELGVRDHTELTEAARELGLISDALEVRGPAQPVESSTTGALRIRRTKLHSPPITVDHIHRPRLIEILERSSETPLTLISAPAGYGKSQLCSSWLERCGLQSVWLSLDEDDDDLRRFLQHLLAAVTGPFPDALDATRTLVGATNLPPVSVLADTLANDLDWIEKDFFLVLDDFHRIRSRPIHDLLTELLCYPPRSLHLVLITRRDPSLPLAGLRADGRLNEVRTSDLRFTGAETAALLDKLAGLTVSADTLAQLERWMEGWVVGLRLAALAFRDTDNADALLSCMSGGVQPIQEYLLQEVLAGQSPRIRDCMLKTSILDRFCEPLCTAVSRGDTPPVGLVPEGAEFVGTLQRFNLFTIPLDTEGIWFRYHHIFQELLSSELKRHLGADEIAELHSRAGDWLESQGLIDEAIDHILESGDPEKAARIVERHIRSVIDEGPWYTIVEWLSRLPESEILSRPELLLGRANAYSFRSEFNKIPPILDRIDDLMGGDPETHSYSREVALFRGVIAFYGGDGASGLEYLDRALDRDVAGHDHLGGIAVIHFMAAGQMVGQEERVRAVATRWLEEEIPLHPNRESYLRFSLRTLDYINGDLDAVNRNIDAHRELARTHNLDNRVAWCDYYSGMFHLQRGVFDQAIGYLEATGELKYHQWKRGAVDAMAALAIAYQANGLPEKAAASLESLREFVGHVDRADVIFADSCATRLQIMQEQLEPDGWWREAPAADTVTPTVFYLDIPYVTRCRALIAEGTAASLAEANRLLRRYVDLNEEHHNIIRQIELRTLQAAAFDRQAENEKALTVLKQTSTPHSSIASWPHSTGQTATTQLSASGDPGRADHRPST